MAKLKSLSVVGKFVTASNHPAMAAMLTAKTLCTDKYRQVQGLSHAPIPPWMLINKWAWVVIVFEVATDNITNDFPCKPEYTSHPTSIFYVLVRSVMDSANCRTFLY